MRAPQRQAATVARRAYCPVPTRICWCACVTMNNGTSNAITRRYLVRLGSCIRAASGMADSHSAAKPTSPPAPYIRSVTAPAGRQSSASATSFTAARANSDASVHSSQATIAIVRVKTP